MDIKCPYCKKDLDIDHDDGYGYEEDIKYQQECEYCKKQFIFETSIVYYYDAMKADCLNDGDHNYKITTTWPKEFSKMQCTMCGDIRDLTDDERIKYKIDKSI